MLLQRFKSLIQQIATGYHALEHYFTSGSFGVKFYPLLMHPCVRHSRSTIIQLMSVLAVFAGLYYFFAELIVSLFSEASLAAYFRHTTLELLLPLDTVIDDKKSTLSPLSFSLRVAYLMQAWLFLLFYFICVTQITRHRFRLLGVLCSLLFTVGASLIYSSQGGKYTAGGLHNIGFEATFIIGNLAMIFSGLSINKPSAAAFKRYSITAGLIGLAAISIPLFLESAFTPILERISIYSLMIWEIMLGFSVLREMK